MADIAPGITGVPSGPPPIPPNISQTTGALFFGILMNWGLFGALSVQLYIYYMNSTNDTKRIKYLVYSLYVLEVIQTVLTTADGFHWFVFGWGNLEQLRLPLASSIDSPFLDGIIALMVQSFFCWRIYVLGKSAIYAIFLFLVALLQCGAGMACGIISVQLNDLSRVREVLTIPTAIWLSGSAFVDTLIAISTAYLLLRQGRGLPSGDYIITRIVRLTVETNALTAGVAVLTLALFIAFPNDNYFVCPPYILGKLYSNTILVVFNNRLAMSQRPSAIVNSSSHGRHDMMSIKNNTTRSHPGVVVNVHRATVKDDSCSFPMDDLSGRDQKQYRDIDPMA